MPKQPGKLPLFFFDFQQRRVLLRAQPAEAYGSNMLNSVSSQFVVGLIKYSLEIVFRMLPRFSIRYNKKKKMKGQQTGFNHSLKRVWETIIFAGLANFSKSIERQRVEYGWLQHINGPVTTRNGITEDHRMHILFSPNAGYFQHEEQMSLRTQSASVPMESSSNGIYMSP